MQEMRRHGRGVGRRLAMRCLTTVLVLGAAMAVASTGVGPVPDPPPAAADDSYNLCGLKFCPPPPVPDPEPPPEVRLHHWYFDEGLGVWVDSPGGVPYGGVVGGEYRFVGFLEDHRGNAIPEATMEVTIGNGCEAVDAPDAPLPAVGTQTLVRLVRHGGLPCLIVVEAEHDGLEYLRFWELEVTQLSPQLTWTSSSGVPIDPPNDEIGRDRLGAVYVDSVRYVGLHSNDPNATLQISESGPCTVDPVGSRVGGTQYFRVVGGATTGSCGMVGWSIASDPRYSPYSDQRVNGVLGVEHGWSFDWLPDRPPPVSLAYPGEPVEVAAQGDLAGVNLDGSGACSVEVLELSGNLGRWRVTPTGVGDCVLTLTTLIIIIGPGGTGESPPPKVATVPVLAPAPVNQAPSASIAVAQASTAAPSIVQLDASASSDPDGDELTYHWAFGDGGLGTGATASPTYTAAGTYTVTLTVLDPTGAAATTTTTVTVTDPTPPVVVPAAAGTVGDDGWFTGDIAISWKAVDAQSPVTSTTGCEPVVVDADTGPDGRTFSCSATSAGGTTTETMTVGLDATPPSLAPVVSPAVVVVGGSATVRANAEDGGAGVATTACDDLDTSTVGARTVTCTATDGAGNAAVASVAYTVVASSGTVVVAENPPLCPPATTDAPFADVAPGDVHADDIDCVTALGILVGKDGTTFDPGGPVTRGQVATVLRNLLVQLGIAVDGDSDVFTDDDGDVHEPAIDALAALGIVTGFADGTVRPTTTITRGQLATLLRKAIEHAVGDSLADGVDAFADDDGDVHEPAVDALAALGILQGVDDASFGVSSVLSRAQLASIAVAALEAVEALG